MATEEPGVARFLAVVRADLFDYDLPESLIAQRPAEKRQDARMLALGADEFKHYSVRELPSLLPARALVVFNETKVRRARLLGHRQTTGGRVELLLIEPLAQRGHWRALGRATRPLHAGDRVVVGGAVLEILCKHVDGTLSVSLSTPTSPQQLGQIPLPPYIRRAPDSDDEERYQTVFAKQLGSVAAPTAGLHFTAEMLDELARRHCELGFLTLHVGLGTFRPVSTADLNDHLMHAEQVEVSERLARQVTRAQGAGRPVVAIGTTVVRALETAASGSNGFGSFSGVTRLFIQPGYRFRVVDALLTNFHMPRSTLLALVCAFAGYELVREAYRVALEHRYRFLSYGDAMWIPRCHDR